MKRLAGVSLAVLLAACRNPTSDTPPPSLTGTWSYDVFVDVWDKPPAYRCSLHGVTTLAQSNGGSVSGSFNTQEYCDDGTSAHTVLLDQQVTGMLDGSVHGDSLVVNDGLCQHTGAYRRHASPDTWEGTTFCTAVMLGGVTVAYSGTWTLSRIN